jgi:hypothetical protein
VEGAATDVTMRVDWSVYRHLGDEAVGPLLTKSKHCSVFGGYDLCNDVMICYSVTARCVIAGCVTALQWGVLQRYSEVCYSVTVRCVTAGCVTVRCVTVRCVTALQRGVLQRYSEVCYSVTAGCVTALQ